MRGYTVDVNGTIARAYGKELPISPKKAYEVCNLLRGKSYNKAKKMLEEIIELKRAVPIRRYNQETAHKRGIGPGRYPVKVSKYMLKVFSNVESNAKEAGINLENSYIAIISASRGMITKGYMQRAHGRSSAWNEQTTNIELVIKERSE
ncbi:MAG: 50S ribosomal protein L22 [Candidatus Thermoplasmatota archaeon]|jgi:large subunit ribosomal protein L22|nr:50S ribosomal protein L22 [Candidatus Thermoplasmatota archaeon]MCL5963003.1 50S ribosomal protein L22 [Candidatus Thermoplasmatota archaeon]